MSMSIKLKRVDRTYRAGEEVEGVVVLKLTSSTAHTGLVLTAEGTVSPQSSGRGAGLFSGGSGASGSITILREEIEMYPAGSFPGRELELPFTFTVAPVDGEKLVETYHGVYVSVTYSIRALLKRSGFMTSHLEAKEEFTVHVPTESEPDSAPVDFSITPETLRNVREGSRGALPPFEVIGRFNQTNCSLGRPLTGHVTVKNSDGRLRSIDLQLVRVETIRTPEGTATEATEIQNLQVGEGDHHQQKAQHFPYSSNSTSSSPSKRTTKSRKTSKSNSSDN